ncbi:TFIID-18kDa-domain-containing protein [Daldinia sp. FL1419]|nr:TFIID-18kDa-domain-containing protein [Daldinia sp. FL1419]
MEPRARAGKNVGKETFNAKEIRALLYAYGDVQDPLPDTVRVLDEIVTEFLEGVCFEASRHAQVAGRQKLKFDDFEFALRRNPQYLGRVKSMIEKRQKIKEMRRTFDQEDDMLAKEHAKDGPHHHPPPPPPPAAPAASPAAPAPAAATAGEDDLLDLDEDEDLVMNTATSSKGGSKKRKRTPK